MDTGPQKESDTPQEAGKKKIEKKNESKRKRHFRTRPDKQSRADRHTDRDTKHVQQPVVVKSFPGKGTRQREVKY